jgi:hypothetical protein
VQQPPSLPSLDECSEDGADSEHEDSWVTTVKRPQMTAAQLSYHLCLQNSDEESDDESAGSDDAGYAGSSDEYDSGSDDDDEVCCPLRPLRARRIHITLTCVCGTHVFCAQEAAGYRLTGRRKMTAEEFAQFLTAGQD